MAKVIFYQLLQDSQDLGSDDEHMVSRVYLNLEIGEDKYSELYVDLKQTVGSNFENAPLEVGSIQGYDGPFNHKAFQSAVEAYYRGLIGSQGRGIHTEGASNIRMRNNVFKQVKVTEFEVNAEEGGW